MFCSTLNTTVFSYTCIYHSKFISIAFVCVAAKKAFVEVGEHLQRARRHDYWDTFSLYLEKTEEDPALKDRELSTKLSNNCSEGEKRLAAVFEKYTKKQEQMGPQCFNDGATTEEPSEEENSDEEDEDNDHFSVDDSIEDNDSEGDIGEVIEEDRSLANKNENNANTVNADQKTDKVVPSEIKIDMEEEHDNKIKIKTVKENNISERRNSIASELKTGRTIAISTSVATKNINGVETKAQQDATNCMSTVNRIEGL